MKKNKGRGRKAPLHLLIEKGPIPAMTSHLAHDELRALASQVRSPASIVEVGVWLGACTRAMAESAAVPIHGYDVFTANWDQVKKAAQAEIKLENGQDTLPLVRLFLGGAPGEVILHKGNAVNARWEGPIGLYVDDACKHQSAFDAVMRTFSPWFIEGAWVALMDFFFYEKKNNSPALMYQKAYVEARPSNFEFVKRIPDSSNAIFRWHR